MLVLPMIGAIAVASATTATKAAACGAILAGVYVGYHTVLHDLVQTVPPAAAKGALFGFIMGLIAGAILACIKLLFAVLLGLIAGSLPRTSDPFGYVYAARGFPGGATKVGRTCHPERRLAELRRKYGSQVRFVLIMFSRNSRASERVLHLRYDLKRVLHHLSSELFNLSNYDLASIFAR